APTVIVFFFQAEDGIRDLIVTGVQTCALPIWPERSAEPRSPASSTRPWSTSRPSREPQRSARRRARSLRHASPAPASSTTCCSRSEERRVGKELGSLWWRQH